MLTLQNKLILALTSAGALLAFTPWYITIGLAAAGGTYYQFSKLGKKNDRKR